MEKTMTEARADALMEDGFHCSQCVFPYAAFRLGMDRDEALRLSAGLGGGCFHGDSCGAVTCLLYTSPSPRDRTRSRMPSSA